MLSLGTPVLQGREHVRGPAACVSARLLAPAAATWH